MEKHSLLLFSVRGFSHRSAVVPPARTRKIHFIIPIPGINMPSTKNTSNTALMISR